VNHLLNRVELAFERERRFSSDLAHELRTPIAELRSACEVGGRWPEDVESTRQFFSDTREIALHLEKIVTALLTVSRSEGGGTLLETSPIAMREFVLDCWQRAPHREKPLEFKETISPDLVVHGDPDILGIIFRNLVENAISHSQPDTRVECEAELNGNGVVLVLTNVPADLGAGDLPHVFDRFWRKDESRSDRRHIGLGLSIARALCGMAGLGLDVALTDGGRFRASILIPNKVVS
jgi:signal transduction histidine kinase